MRAAALLTLLASLVAHGAELTAQTPRVTVSEAASADTVGFGDRFALTVQVELPAGTMAWVPDRLPESESVASLGAPAWTAAPREGGGSTVTLTYDLVAYEVGEVRVPNVVVLTGAASGDGPPVAPFDAAGGPPAEGLDRYTAVGRPVWVRSLLTLEDMVQGLQPRAADDVVGASWHAPTVLASLAFASILLVVGFASGRDWLAARERRAPAGAGAPLDPVEAARRRALEELDALLAGGPPEPHDIETYYRAGSDAVRRYVEHLDGAWTPALTATELMAGLRDRAIGEGDDPLPRRMGRAEVVKFGRLRPESVRAVEHCRALRAWVEAS